MRIAIVMVLAVACAAFPACGGGGSELIPGELAPWEIEEGVCSFDDERAVLIARDAGANCQISMRGNTLNGAKWPPKSWPSSEYVWK